jgi:arylformamidase
MERKRTSIKHHSKKITISEVSCDISHLISQDIPIYPGNPSPKFESVLNIEKDGVNVSRITLGTHTGTHVDSQNHFLTNGIGIEREPLSKFIGQAMVLDFSKKTIGDGINGYDLNYYSSVTRSSDIILLYTGISNYWNHSYMDKIGKKLTYLEPSAADWIIKHKIKSIGIDTFSVEKYGSKKATTHKRLLSAGVGIIENLNSNLKKFVGKRVFLVCLPLALKGMDASPARAVIFDILD